MAKPEAIAFSLEVVPVTLLVRNGEGTETKVSVLLDVVLKTGLELLSLVVGADFDEDTDRTLDDTLELASGLLAVGDLGTLVDGFKGFEVEESDSSTGAGRVAERRDGGGFDSRLILGAGSVGGKEDDIVCGETAVGLDGFAIDGWLVGGEGIGLVGAQDGDIG